MLRKLTYDEVELARAEVRNLPERHFEAARKIFSELSSEEIAEGNVTVESIFETLENLQYAIDAGAALVRGYASNFFNIDGVFDYRVDKALGII